MQSTDKEKIKGIREQLPRDYAELLFQHYKRKKMKISKSLIYKVANGERMNVIIAEDLMELANQRQEFLQRLEVIEKRRKKPLKSKIGKFFKISNKS